MLSIFSCVFWPSVCLLWSNVCLCLLTIFWLGCLVCFYCCYWAARAVFILWRLILFGFFVCKYFLPFLGCVFVLFMVSFAMQNFLRLIRSHFKILFIFITLAGGSKKILLWFRSIQPMFSSKSFTVSSLTFRSLILFEFIFVYCVREYSNFIISCVAVQFS